MKKKIIGFFMAAILLVGQNEMLVWATDFDTEQSDSGTGQEHDESIITGLLPTDPDAYLIADSATRVISADEVGSFDKSLLKMSIKEIYARRGVRFSDADVQAYFAGKSWYVGTIDEADFSDDMLNNVERQNISILNECIENYSEDASGDSEYEDLYNANTIEDLENYVGEKVICSGRLIANNVSAFSVEVWGPQMPYVTVNYDPDKYDKTLDNQGISEHPISVTVWGTLTTGGNAPQIDMEHIFMGGNDSGKASARLVDYDYFTGDWPENIGEIVKCIGIFRMDSRWQAWDRSTSDQDFLESFCNSPQDDRTYLSSGNKFDYLNLSYDFSAIGEMSINGITTSQSFANTPVAVYGSMVNTGIMCVEYIEPLPKSQWTPEIESMNEVTDMILSQKDEYITNDLLENWGFLFEEDDSYEEDDPYEEDDSYEEDGSYGEDDSYE